MVRKADESENPTPVETTVETTEGTVEVTAEMIAASGKSEDGFTDDMLREIESFDDIKTVAGIAGSITSIGEVLGTGFSVLDDKMRLVGIQFIVVKFSVHKSEKNGGEFSTLHVVTDTKEKWIVNDGSTGIHEQMKELKEKMGAVCPLLVPRGLRVSEYDYTDGKGNTSRAATFYLNTSR